MYWASWGVCWMNPEFGRCSFFSFLVGLRTYQHPLDLNTYGRIVLKIDLKWYSYECVDWLNLIKIASNWRNLMTIAMTIRIPRKSQNFSAVNKMASAMCHTCNELINYKFWSRSWSNDVRHVMTTKISVRCRFSVLHFCKDDLSAWCQDGVQNA